MNKFVLILLFLAPLMSIAQESDESFLRAGLLRAQGNLAFGQLIDQNAMMSYLGGDMDYYISENISVRSSSFYSIPLSDSESEIHMNHSLFTGLMFHKSIGKQSDLYGGFEPGIIYGGARTGGYGDDNRLAVVPLLDYEGFIPAASFTIGYNYYAKKIFHLFVAIKHVHATMTTDDLQSVPFNELKLSFGLGWNLNLKK